ncbi:helix-turn-helix domain-containing protein [Clostridium sp.]|uniref:helix-turn-helix domain-containing protein n=1 Tax=Clostridium sp. TaxID=1506 RepID=UPI0025C12351|nr:helix-turn-helix transcriptional regulator [Clostridium sp.]
MLSKSLKKIRKENKLGIRELERLSNVSHTIIINIESGKSKNPTIIPIIKLAKALDVSLDELVFGKE